MKEYIEKPKIDVVDHEISQTVSSQWKLRILWRFMNQNDGVLYILIAHPLPILTDGQLILDHSAPTDPDELYFNVIPGFEFVEASSLKSVERWLSCTLEPPGSLEFLTLIGRFGYSYVRPDPDWERTRNWKQVKNWQQIADSNALLVTLKN